MEILRDRIMGAPLPESELFRQNGYDGDKPAALTALDWTGRMSGARAACPDIS